MVIDTKKILSDMTLEEKAEFCSGAGVYTMKGVEKYGIPSVYICDGPHGLRKPVGAGDHLGLGDSKPSVCYPTASALASSFDRDLVHGVASYIGRECQSENVAMILGPGLNIKRSPLCGRNFEYFSEDPYLSGELTTAFVRGVQKEGVAASLKHYIANEQETMRLVSDSLIDERTLREIYLACFENPVKNADPKNIMCSYNKVNGTYLAENKRLLTDILRDEWGFGGFVVSDWGAVHDRVEGLNAGMDLEMPGVPNGNTEKIVAAVNDGRLSMDLLDASVIRILEFLKWHMEGKKDVDFNKDEGHSFAKAAAEQCAVLLKNEGILPLSRSAKVAMIGALAYEPRFQGGGSSNVNPYKQTSAVDAASDYNNIFFAKGYDMASDAIDDSLLAEAIKTATEVDAVVLFVGVSPSYDSEGMDRSHLNLPANQQHLINEICKLKKDVIVVLHGGGPISMPWVNDVSAILDMYLSGEAVGAATLAILFGDANPSGKLAESFPIKLSDTPAFMFAPGERGVTSYNEGIYVGYRYYDKREMEVLFPFGHGLSYAQFNYSDLKLDKTTLNDNEMLAVSFKLMNTGVVKGKEVVQLYVRDVESSVGRPIRELKAFEKVELNPGEEKTISIMLDKKAFAYFEIRLNDWHVESGQFVIEVGASSRDIRLSELVEVISTIEIPHIFTSQSTLGEIAQTSKGKALMEQMSQSQKQRNTANLSESTREMMETVRKKMPLMSLVGFGVITEEQMHGILKSLNEK